MRVTAAIFGLFPGFRVALYELPSQGEIWIKEFADRTDLITYLLDVGIINHEERRELIDHDFAYSFTTTQTEIDLLDALTAGFLPYKKNPPPIDGALGSA